MSIADHTTSVEYRDIQDAPGYRVGNDGSVWSCWKPGGAGRGHGFRYRMTAEWKRLRSSPSPSGHHFIGLGASRKALVHRLVLEAFVGPCPPGMECRHKNGNPSDNRVCNLAWGTRQENVEDMYRHGTYRGGVPMKGSENPAAILTESQVIEIRRLRREGRLRRRQIAERFGVTMATVADIVSGRSWKHVAF